MPSSSLCLCAVQHGEHFAGNKRADLPQTTASPLPLAPLGMMAEDIATRDGCKYSGPPLFLCGDYEVLSDQDETPHIEAFAVIWGSAWLARKVEHGKPGEIRRLVAANSTMRDGLPWHGLNEIALTARLGDDRAHTFVTAFVAPNERLKTEACLHFAYPYVEHDLLSYTKLCRPDARSAQSLSRELLVAVDHLHSIGIRHRNIKQQCILVQPNGTLKLGGLCTANLVSPSITKSISDSCITTLTGRPPECLLGARGHGPAQDIWACGIVISQICDCFMSGWSSCVHCDARCSSNSEEEFAYLLAIFARLGKPPDSHPLAQLPRWKQIPWSRMPFRSHEGWEDAKQLLGKEGVRLLLALTDLDASRRPSSTAALLHQYFQRPPAGCEVVEVFGGEEEVIQAFCATGMDAWRQDALEDIASTTLIDCQSAREAPLSALPIFTTEAAKDAEDGRTTETMEASVTKKLDVQDLDPWGCVRRRAFGYYIEEDLAREWANRRHMLTVIGGISSSLAKHGNCCADVCRCIYFYVFRERCPLNDCMHPFAANINMAMRAILNHWLIQVSFKYSLEETALFSAIDMVDAYLLKHPFLLRSRFQLLGIVALMVASKIIGEIPISPEEASYVTDTAYTVSEVKDFELELLLVYGDVWRGWGPFHFLSYYIAELRLSKFFLHLGSMLLECSTLAYELSRHAPGMLAAGVCVLAAGLCEIMDGGDGNGWIKRVQNRIGHDLSSMCGRDFDRIVRVAKEVCCALDSCCLSKHSLLDGLKSKYSKATYSFVFCKLEPKLPLGKSCYPQTLEQRINSDS